MDRDPTATLPYPASPPSPARRRQRGRPARGAVAAALLCAAAVVILPGGGTASAQTTIWSATMTVGTDALSGPVKGWRSIGVAMNGDALTDTTVTYDGVDYPLFAIILVTNTDNSKTLSVSFSGLTTSSGGLFDQSIQAAMKFHVGDQSFNLGEATESITAGTLGFSWENAGLDWTHGDGIALSLTVDFGPRPRRAFARSSSAGIWFDQAIDGANLPPASAFEVTADGMPIRVGGVGFNENLPARLELSRLSPPIGRGQALRLRYTDPTAGEDTAAVQSLLGTDAASFALGAATGDAGPFNNNSKLAPTVSGAPTGLGARRTGQTEIELSWTAPGSTGGRAITGYRVEYCAASCDRGTAVWRELEDHTQSVEKTYTDSGLVVAETRHYRVTAVNEIGAGDPSETAMQTVPGVAGLLFSRDSLFIDEGESASYTVRLTVPPTVTVTLAVTGGDATASPTPLSFSPSDWNVAQTVTVSGVRDHTLEIYQGGQRVAPYVKRLNRPHNDRWRVTVTPSGGAALAKADIALSLGPKASCEMAGAVCTANGEALSSTATATVLGPPRLSVADARIEEAAGAKVDFEVTMSRASEGTVTVDYATSDGTATAGADYTETSGTLTFAPGETAKTVEVAVLGDDHDEGEETFTLTLSNPRGGNAWLKDGSADGTIENTGPMPRAWLARFGRTVADQVIEAVEDRLRTPPGAGVKVSLAGRALRGATEEELNALEEREAERRLEAISRWLAGEDDDAGGPGESRALTGRDFLTGSSFALTGGSAEGGFAGLWGRGALSRFDGREGKLTLSGEVTSALLGAEFAREPGMVGLMLSHARGEGSYRGAGNGEVESTLTGLYPYGRYRVNERVTLWGVAGYGAGELTLTPRGQAAMEAGMDLVMGAAGVRGVARAAPAEGGLELAVTPDAMAVRTTSERTAGLAGAEAEVSRLRLGLEASWRGLEAGGRTLVPRVEIGARHDGGDAETGFGLDVGGGLSWSLPVNGLSAELSWRGLLSHEADGFRDRGFAGSLAWDLTPGTDRGPSLAIAHSAGARASGGMEALLGLRQLEGVVANDAGGELERRTLGVKLGYGFAVFGDRFTTTPEVGLRLSDGLREYRLGWRLGLARGEDAAFELGLEATRREAANDDAEPVQALTLRGRLGW